jgi:hypothetical protein
MHDTAQVDRPKIKQHRRVDNHSSKTIIRLSRYCHSLLTMQIGLEYGDSPQKVSKLIWNYRPSPHLSKTMKSLNFIAIHRWWRFRIWKRRRVDKKVLNLIRLALILTTKFSVYLFEIKVPRRVEPDGREYLLLLGTFCYVLRSLYVLLMGTFWCV